VLESTDETAIDSLEPVVHRSVQSESSSTTTSTSTIVTETAIRSLLAQSEQEAGYTDLRRPEFRFGGSQLANKDESGLLMTQEEADSLLSTRLASFLSPPRGKKLRQQQRVCCVAISSLLAR